MFLGNNKQTGFTIVELLIVIVVIAILAAISIIAYTGIQKRAKVSTVQNEISIFLKQAELFKVDSPTGFYPANDTQFKQVLSSSNMWDTTRASSRSYVYCMTSAEMTIVSYNYIEPVVSGTILYYGSSMRGQQTIAYDATIPAGSVSERICGQTLPSATYRQWAHNLT